MHRKRILSVLIITTAAGFLAACSSNEKRLAEPGPVVSGVQTEIVHLESAPQLYQAVGAIRSATPPSWQRNWPAPSARSACKPAIA